MSFEESLVWHASPTLASIKIANLYSFRFRSSIECTVCNKLVASDYSVGMLKQAKKKLKVFDNVEIKKIDITNINAKDDAFDVVVAGNVIHLLPNPQSVMKELTRVCKDGGKLIIPNA